MKKKILLFACTALLTLSRAFAGSVTVQDAQNVAVNFFTITLGSNAPRTITATLQYTRTETDNTVDFYVFNMSPVKGFVIVSATDNDVPVIGYSTESAFRNDFSKIGLNEWLNRWSTELHYVQLNNVIATPRATVSWAAYRQGVAPANLKLNPVGPLCQTTWDQENELAWTPVLYNTFCPGRGTGQAVTGCVATAMAQIMKYWSYPAVGIGSNTYVDDTINGYSANYGTLTANFADSTFDWANMPDSLTNTSTTTQINAVGRIMSCAGISVDMDYDSTGSGAAVLTDEAGGGTNPPCAQVSYVRYFGYQNIIEGIGLSNTGSGANNQVATAAFIDSIEADLAAGRLVQVEGSDQTYGGHTWVCDGFDVNNYLHMNWGWSGQEDGYFAITNLDPNAGGEQLDFANDIGILTHIMPPVPPANFHEQAAATFSAVCPGSPTQLSATTHVNASYSWVPTTNLSNANISNPVATPAATTTYTVTADSAGVTATSSVTITVHQAPTATISTAANPTCNGSDNGSVTVAAGGTSGYSYKWNNNATVAALTNLGAGTYTVTITDVNSCTATASKTLSQPTALSASAIDAVNATCGQNNGSLTASVSGGTSNYHYLWSNGQTAVTATGLGGGTATVTVTDAHNCTITASAVLTSSGSLHLATSATNILCYGSSTGTVTATVTGNTGNVTYSWSNGATTAAIQNAGATTYDVTITDAGSGCSATAAKTVSQPTELSASVSVTDAGCGNAPTGSATVTAGGGTAGYTYHWSNGSNSASISNVVANTYDVTITDANSCTATADAVVNSATPISVVATSDNVTCNGDNNGSAQVNVSNGTQPYTYSWSNGASSASVSGLIAGSLGVTITDANNCSASANVAVTQPTAIQVTTTTTNTTGAQDNGSATVSGVSGGTAPYTYSWSNGSTGQTISNLAPGTYTVTVTDANSCNQTATDLVTVSTGLSNLSGAITFTVCPNPAGSYVLVQLNGFNGSTVLSLKNILGQTVISQSVAEKQTQLDLSALAKGVYLVEVIQGEKTAIKQLVIAK